MVLIIDGNSEYVADDEGKRCFSKKKLFERGRCGLI